MEYIQGVMANYLKPLICTDNDEPLEKQDFKESKPIIETYGMGDFDYQNCKIEPFNVQEEFKIFEQISEKTNNLFAKIEEELAANIEEQRNLEKRLDSFEKSLEEKKQLFEACRNLCNKEISHIEILSEKNERYAENIHYHEEILDSWQIIIDEFRKIPQESVKSIL